MELAARLTLLALLLMAALVSLRPCKVTHLSSRLHTIRLPRINTVLLPNTRHPLSHTVSLRLMVLLPVMAARPRRRIHQAPHLRHTFLATAALVDQHPQLDMEVMEALLPILLSHTRSSTRHSHIPLRSNIHQQATRQNSSEVTLYCYLLVWH